MTSNTVLVTILTTWISISALLVVVTRLLPSVRLDRFRQSMFALRDEMFDYALAGNIRFDDPAYRLLRKSMNGFIRYAHNLTFYRIAIELSCWRLIAGRPETKWSDSWDKALATIADERVKADMLRFHERTMGLVAERVVLGSPFLIALLVVVFFQYGIQSLTENLARSLTRFVDPKILEEEAARAAA